MRYDFDKLYKAVASRLSEKRYMHTLGVEKAAIRLSERLMPECDAEEMRAAALLHDITKEMDLAEQISRPKITTRWQKSLPSFGSISSRIIFSILVGFFSFSGYIPSLPIILIR